MVQIVLMSGHYENSLRKFSQVRSFLQCNYNIYSFIIKILNNHN